jgi:hypothetical protein
VTGLEVRVPFLLLLLQVDSRGQLTAMNPPSREKARENLQSILSCADLNPSSILLPGHVFYNKDTCIQNTTYINSKIPPNGQLAPSVPNPSNTAKAHHKLRNIQFV